MGVRVKAVDSGAASFRPCRRPVPRLGLIVCSMAAMAFAGAVPDASAQDRSLRSMNLSSFIDATSLEQLANMVVTDTKVPQAPDSVTQKIVVLHHDEFERQPVVNRNLAELVRYTSGQFVNVLSRNDANWGSYGGLGPKYNSYLLDGIPIDSFSDAMSIDSAAIERIEIHKGPASVLYSNYLTMDFSGNETPLAGTTNFVLKNRVDTPLTRIGLGLGSWNTQAGRAYHQDSAGNLSYIVSAGYERSDYTQYGNRDSWLQTVGAPDYEKTRVFGNLHYAFDRLDHTLSLFVHHAGQDGTMGRPNRDYQHRYDTLNLAYNNRFADDWTLQFKLGERRYDRGFANDNFPTSLAFLRYETTRQVIRPMDLSLSYLHGGDSVLTFGADRQQVHYWTTNRSAAGALVRENDARSVSSGVFVQEKVHWNGWVLRAGLRRNTVDHEYALLGGGIPAVGSKSWQKNLWSLGLRYNVAPGLALYGNVGSSFMVPAAKQIGGTVTAPGASGELANPGLRPESGRGRDFGIDWQPMPVVNVGVRAFFNTIQDAIVTGVVNATQTRSENAGSAQARGLEFDLRYVPNAELALFANLTRTLSRVDNPSSADIDRTEVPFSPRAIANIGLSGSLPGQWTISPYFQWVGRYFDSNSRSGRLAFGKYGVLNLRLQRPLAAGIELFADLNNLGNRHYRMPFDFRDPGSNAFGGVNVSF